ncbi:oligosaccharide flippase family protein [Aliiglaciecola sp. SL4]|uniref:oligosaccharide flippase family protein n=1 Tax=Aliiglaciecola sp. SL4 TaxID=3239806 RepID=UPI00355B0BE1
MSSLRRALVYSFAGKYSVLTIDFLAVMLISRILTPEEIGLYSIAAASIVIGQVLRDFGLSLYLVKEKDLSTEKIQTCFTISLAICWAITLFYYVMSPFAAKFFGRVEVELLIQVLSINFIIIPFGTLSLSLLKRDLFFDKIMKSDIFSTILRVIVTLTLAFQGEGVYALAIGSVVGTLASVAFLLRYSKFIYYRINLTDVKKIIGFSSVISLSNLISEFRQIIPEFVIGKYHSIEGVAFYSKASATSGIFSKLILQAVSPTIQPFLAKLNNSDSNLAQPVLKIFNYIQIFSIPFYVFVFSFSDPIVTLLYGEQWQSVPPLLEVICLSMIVISLLPSVEQMLNVMGQEKFVLWLAIGMFLIRLIYIAIFVMYDFELLELLYLFLTLSILRLIILLPKIIKIFGVNFSSYSQIVLNNSFISLVLGIEFFVIIHYLQLNLYNPLIMLAILAVTFTTWLFMLLLTKHEILSELARVAFFNNVKSKLKLRRE